MVKRSEQILKYWGELELLRYQLQLMEFKSKPLLSPSERYLEDFSLLALVIGPFDSMHRKTMLDEV